LSPSNIRNPDAPEGKEPVDAEDPGVLLAGSQLEGAPIAVKPREGVPLEGKTGVFGEVELPEGELYFIRLRYVLSRSLACLPDTNPIRLALPLMVNEHPPCALPPPYLHTHCRSLGSSQTPTGVHLTILELEIQKP
jgi:hypothetical protein